MRTLLELLPRMQALGVREAVRYFNGYRTWKLSYKELSSNTARVARLLAGRGLGKGDRVLIWGENRPEWIYSFWACLARGIEVVPLDYRFSPQLVSRIQHQAGARLLIRGDEVDASGFSLDQLSFASIAELAAAGVAREELETVEISPDDVVEIVYTSGTTGEPKGVVHRHRHIAANLSTLAREIESFRWVARPFQPIRLLDLLPLSHLFGQSLGLFIPLLLEGSVVLTGDLRSGALIETIRRERVSVVVAVPQMLANLRRHVEPVLPASPGPSRWKGWTGALATWLRYRRIHAEFGWKFWALVVGGAALDADLEQFWRHLGFAVVQGYGLTEASPVIAVNHPLRTRPGSIGSALAGQEIKLAPDGEILVRGPSVVTEYLGGSAPESHPAGGLDDESTRDAGWLRTGDIAEMDADGRLYYRGRKSERIVRADGLNVYPQDVEAALNQQPGVQDSVVVGLPHDGEERIHAAVLVVPGQDSSPASLAETIRAVNRTLESHQRIQSWSLWPEPDFPRTAATGKVRRRQVAEELVSATPGSAGSQPLTTPRDLDDLLAEALGRRLGAVEDGQPLEDLGLSSLQRLDLMGRIETLYGVDLDEESFASIVTIGELRSFLLRQKKAAARQPQEAGAGQGRQDRARGAHTVHDPSEAAAWEFLTKPRWARALPIRIGRAASLDLAILPMVRELVRLRVGGIENLAMTAPPVIFAANHASHFDTAVLYAALPRAWRRRLAPAMSQEYFGPLFEPRRFSREMVFESAGQFLLACGLFNAYPLPRSMGGTRRALLYTGELIGRGYCPLVFPEGQRTSDGAMLPFKSGIGLMASRLQVPVVPVYLEGVFEIYSVHHEWPQPGRATVRFGRALRFPESVDYETATKAVEHAVRQLAPPR